MPIKPACRRSEAKITPPQVKLPNSRLFGQVTIGPSPVTYPDHTQRQVVGISREVNIPRKIEPVLSDGKTTALDADGT
jgi:hypothetical protein